LKDIIPSDKVYTNSDINYAKNIFNISLSEDLIDKLNNMDKLIIYYDYINEYLKDNSDKDIIINKIENGVRNIQNNSRNKTSKMIWTILKKEHGIKKVTQSFVKDNFIEE